ncbi:MAG: DUF5058 family protein [Acetatifactor sp.]|nr:DUF5058 family protein [Acetatifactor sp.]
MLESLNSPVIYLICGGIILFVFVLCVILLIRSYCAGIKLGMDKRKLTRVIASSATFSIFPSIGILLGVIALSGNGMFTFEGDFTPILVSAVSALVKAFFTFLVGKKHFMWLDSISVACSMFVGMIVAVIF